MNDQTVLERMIDKFRRSPAFVKEIADIEQSAAAARHRLCSDYDKAREADAEDPELSHWRQEHSRLTDEAKKFLERAGGLPLAFLNQELADRLHRLAVQIDRRAQLHDTEVRRLKALLLETVPPAVESKIQTALQRIADLADAARKSSFERNTNVEMSEDVLGEVFLKSFDSFSPVVSRLLPMARQAAIDVAKLRLTSLDASEVDEPIAAILDRLPELRRVTCRLNPKNGGFVEV